MVDRVLISTTGAKVSKPGANVSTCSNKDLLFNSARYRSGMIYAGGQGLSISSSGSNFLTTNSKSSLGYIPLVVSTEKIMGAREWSDAEEEFWISHINMFETTTSTYTPVHGDFDFPSEGSSYSGSSPFGTKTYYGWSSRRSMTNFIVAGRNYEDLATTSEQNTNCNYYVLRIPCAFGYMNSTYFG